MPLPHLALVAMLLLSFEGRSQGIAWNRLSPTSSPSARVYHAMAYDTQRDRIVLVGGRTGSGLAADTWEFDGLNWKQIKPTTSPPARETSAMAFDAGRRRLVLYGGRASGYLSDTWEWDGKSWHAVKPVTTPGARHSHGMFYDPTLKKVVLFGGRTSTGTALNDTWTWDGKTWVKLTPKTSPVQRMAAAVSYDPIRRRAVVFGGWTSSWTNLDDTWEWDGKTWTKVAVATSRPSKRHHLPLVCSKGICILFGGSEELGCCTSTPKDDTWWFDGKGWHRVDPTRKPSVRRGHAAIHDVKRDRVVLFGGASSRSGTPVLGDTWTLSTVTPSYRLFGKGCAGSSTAPTLQAPTAPRVGTTFCLLVGRLKPRTGGVIVVGDSNNTWRGSRLPMDLGFFGMTGCSLLVSWTSEVAVFSANGGTFVWKGAVPNRPALVGAEFYNQAWVLDAAANARGIATSNGGKGVVGF